MVSQKKINSFTTYLLLLAVYGIFFTVQLTSNFDIPGNLPLLSAKITNQASGFSGKQNGIRQVRHASPKKINIRLNKRFHPEFAPEFTIFFTAIPIFYLENADADIYTGPKISAGCFLKQQQRGPPVIA